MMMFTKGGWGPESGKKWLHNLSYVINFYQTNLYFFT